jgi:hypothetical protein
VLNLPVARFELDLPLNLEFIITKKIIIKFFFPVIRGILHNIRVTFLSGLVDKV